MSHRAAPRQPRTSCRRRRSAARRADRILAALGRDDIKVAQALFRTAPKSQWDKILARIPEQHRDVFHPLKLVQFKLSGLPISKGAERRQERLERKPTVTFFRTYKYRLYPTRAQSQRLETWCAAACAVYNARNERYRVEGHKGTLYWHKGDGAARGAGPPGAGRICYSRLFGANGKLKTAAERAGEETLAWLNDAPAEALWTAVRDVERAWQAYERRCRERKRGNHIDHCGRPRDDRPSYRSGSDRASFRLQVWASTNKGRDRRCNVLVNHRGARLPKLGWISLRKHRRLVGETREATVLREDDRWYVAISAEVTALERLAPDRVIGVDLGVVCPVMTSDGETLGVTPPSPRLEKLAKRAQRRMDRKTPGSRGWCKWRKTLKRHRRRSAAEIRRQLHEAAKQLADSARLVRMENLNLRAMSARGKVVTDGESRTSSGRGRPGRRLLDVPKYEFRRIVGYKLEARGGRLELVSPAYTSQRCHRCGHIERRNRVTQSEFRCQRCGHTDHADLNAARNIRDSGVDVAFRPEVERDLFFDLESRGAGNRPASKPHVATTIAGRCDQSDASKSDSSIDGSDADADASEVKPRASGPFRN